jgi:hypothetical protein
MVTFWWADPFSCTNATAYLHDVVAAEVPGVVIEYEAANEPQAAQAGDVKSCILPVLLNATSASGVDVGVGVGSYWEVVTYASLSTTLNWHSYNGGGNGAGLQAEIDNLTTLANSFSPPKPLLLTEWHARPAQPMAAAMPVIRDNGIGAFIWSLMIGPLGNAHWGQEPVGAGDPPFQGLLWPNGSAFDEVEEVACMRTQCKTVRYVHHCCNDRNPSENDRFAFSHSEWHTVCTGFRKDGGINTTDGHCLPPLFRLEGPREGSSRRTRTPGANVSILLPAGTARVGLFLPTSPSGCNFSVTLRGQLVHEGTTSSSTVDWVVRTMVPSASAAAATAGVEERTMAITVARDAPVGCELSISGATFFSEPDA